MEKKRQKPDWPKNWWVVPVVVSAVFFWFLLIKGLMA